MYYFLKTNLLSGIINSKVIAFLILQIYFAKSICNTSLLTFRVAAYENVFISFILTSKTFSN